MKFTLEAKSGPTTLVALVSRIDVEPSKEDIQNVIEVEQYLERLFGYRFHINIPNRSSK